jgi:hypothetical protein
MNFKRQYEIAAHLANLDTDGYQEVELILEHTSNATDKLFTTKVMYRTEATIVIPLEQGVSIPDLLGLVDEYAFERAKELNLVPFTWYFNEEMYK